MLSTYSPRPLGFEANAVAAGDGDGVSAQHASRLPLLCSSHGSVVEALRLKTTLTTAGHRKSHHYYAHYSFLFPRKAASGRIGKTLAPVPRGQTQVHARQTTS